MEVRLPVWDVFPLSRPGTSHILQYPRLNVLSRSNRRASAWRCANLGTNAVALGDKHAVLVPGPGGLALEWQEHLRPYLTMRPQRVFNIVILGARRAYLVCHSASTDCT